MKMKAFYLLALIVLSLGWWLSAGFLLSSQGPDWPVTLAIVAWLFISALALAATRVSHSAWIYAGLLVLAVLSWLPSVLVHILPDHLSLGFGLTLLIPPIAVLITLLLYSGLASKTWPSAGAVEGEDSQAKRKQAERAAVVLVLSALTLVCWQFAILIFGSSGPLWLMDFLRWLIILAIVLLVVSAMVWAARKIQVKVWIYAGLFILAGLFLPTSLFVQLPGEPFSSLQAMTFLLILSTALITAALLLYSGLTLYQERQNAGAVEGGGLQAQRKHAGRAMVVVLVLSTFLLAKTLHNLYWLTVWDNTYDSLGYFWLVFPVVAALFSGITLSIALPGKTKLAGFLYPLLISALMIAVSARAQRVDFRQLTEERAERARQAIETFYAQEGHYPQDLRQLTPFYILTLPDPVIIYGQSWCYQGGQDDYRFGYLDREHWSSPILFGRVYSAKGHSPLKEDICQPAIDTYRVQHPDWDRVLQDYGRPTPTPDIGE